MVFRNKVIGVILILLGALPLLLKIKSIGDAFASSGFLSWIVPGEIIYQIVIVVLGLLLLIRFRTSIESTRY